MIANPKRGLYRQWEPDPRVADLSELLWRAQQAGTSFKTVAARARQAILDAGGHRESEVRHVRD